METTIKVQMRQDVRTEYEWLNSNPVIPKGCMAISSDRGNSYRIGDGASRWSELSYNSAKASDVPPWAKENQKPIYTKYEVGLGNVENKSSSQIRSEITRQDIVDGLGYTPVETPYVHPDRHPADIITEDYMHRFVTDNEKYNWNNKATISIVRWT